MEPDLTPHEALLACRNKAGSDSAMARDMETTQPTIWRWCNTIKQMPAEQVLKAERLYGVSRHLLRPDIYPRDYPPAPDAAEAGDDSHRLSEAAE